MSISNKIKTIQQAEIKKQLKDNGAHRFSEILDSPELLNTFHEFIPGYRNRIYTPAQTLSMFISQALSKDCSCQKVVNDFVVNKLINGVAPSSSATGAYCRARYRLPLKLITALSNRVSELVCDQTPKQWRWKGKQVLLVDGTTVTMPDTEENQKEYPQSSQQESGLGFPISRIVGVICLSSGAILNAAVGAIKGKGSDEQTLLRGMLQTFKPGDVVIGDAFYGTYFLLVSLLKNNIDGVFEQMGVHKQVTDFKLGQVLGKEDHIIELKRPKKKPDWMGQEEFDEAPKSINIRELKVGKKIIITTFLTKKKASKNELRKLYKKRWNIEVDFRNLKTTMGLRILSGKTPEMNKKEIWVYFLAYNIVRLLMAQAAFVCGILPRQISFKHTIQLWSSWRLQASEFNSGALEILFILIAENRVGKRPDRIEPRAVKRRPNPMPLLTIPRAEARAEIKKNGHAKKLK